MIELGKSELKTKARDKREYAKNTMLKKTKNRSGVTETRIVTCGECGEEFCNGKLKYNTTITCFILANSYIYVYTYIIYNNIDVTEQGICNVCYCFS